VTNSVSGRPTSGDVAIAAGVSRATVSYVLNRTAGHKISPETRQRVLDAAASLNYQPSAAARTLRSGRSDVVLCLLPNLPIGSEVGRWLEQQSAALAEHGMTFLAHPRPDTDGTVATLLRSVTPAVVLTFERLDRQDRAAMRAAGVAEIELVTSRGKAPRGAVIIPDEHLGRVQVEHLLSKGCRRLGYALPPDERMHQFAWPRYDGARKACVEHGVDEPVLQAVPLEPAQAADAVERWGSAVAGICAYNDEVALAVMSGARRLARRVPEDLAVIGVGDTPAGRLVSPTLTTVRMDLQAATERLIRVILARSGRGAAPKRPPAATAVDVIQREST
jgi:DNA-binding LacI/PurR family transcriptional regulator